jgi:hypothetical protein
MYAPEMLSAIPTRHSLEWTEENHEISGSHDSEYEKDSF